MLPWTLAITKAPRFRCSNYSSFWDSTKVRTTSAGIGGGALKSAPEIMLHHTSALSLNVKHCNFYPIPRHSLHYMTVIYYEDVIQQRWCNPFRECHKRDDGSNASCVFISLTVLLKNAKSRLSEGQRSLGLAVKHKVASKDPVRGMHPLHLATDFEPSP